MPKFHMGKKGVAKSNFLVLPERIFPAMLRKVGQEKYWSGGAYIRLTFKILSKKYPNAYASINIWYTYDDDDNPILNQQSYDLIKALAGNIDSETFNPEDAVKEKFMVYVKPSKDKKTGNTYNNVIEVLPYDIDDKAKEEATERLSKQGKGDDSDDDDDSGSKRNKSGDDDDKPKKHRKDDDDDDDDEPKKKPKDDDDDDEPKKKPKDDDDDDEPKKKPKDDDDDDEPKKKPKDDDDDDDKPKKKGKDDDFI